MQFISAAYAALIMNTTKNSNNIEVARVFCEIVILTIGQICLMRFIRCIDNTRLSQSTRQHLRRCYA